MKAIKIVGLLCTVVLSNNLQSMEQPTRYPLEERLLNGSISYAQYLSILEKTSEYGSMLRDLRTARYMDPADNLYRDFINRMDYQLQQLRDMLDRWDPSQEITREEAAEGILEEFYGLRQTIPFKHDILIEMIGDGRARLLKFF